MKHPKERSEKIYLRIDLESLLPSELAPLGIRRTVERIELPPLGIRKTVERIELPPLGIRRTVGKIELPPLGIRRTVGRISGFEGMLPS